MAKYTKAIAAIVGGIVGIVLVMLGITETAEVPADWEPLVAMIVTVITGAIGVAVSPKNKD